jgi:long-chain acyl-CoA synthetase
MLPVIPSAWPSLVELFSSTCDRHGNRPAFTAYDDTKRTLTYAEARRRVAGIAAALNAAGVGDGDHVALTGANSPEWALAYFGILAAGAAVAPLDHQLKPEDALLLYQAGDCVAFFADRAKFEFFQERAPGARAAWSLDASSAPTLASVEPSDSALNCPPSDREAAILFTSGTTGNPKGVVLTHANLTSDCLLAQQYMELYPTDVFYALLPLHHSYTMLAVLIEAVSAGAEIVFATKLAVSQVLRELKLARVTMFLGVPLLFNKLLSGILDGVRKRGLTVYVAVRALMAVSGFLKKTIGINPGKKLFRPLLEQASLSTIRICISGGGPLAPEVFQRYNQLGIDFVQGYGLTETSPILALNPVYAYRETSVGKVIPQVELRILNPDETGQGEIAVRGPMVMRGYYKNETATRAVLSPDGWLNTGDVGRVRDNYLTITGRSKSLIVTEGGKNVYPEEIEFAFQLHDDVEQVLVRGFTLDAALRSEGIEALIFPSEQHQGTHEAELRPRFQKIIDLVNSGLLPYQRITRFHLLSQPLEMTTTRKIRRL